MAPLALALVLVSAVMHATWNLFAKRASGGATFTWLFDALAVGLYLPLAVAVVVVERPRLGALAFVFIAGSGILQVSYFLLLQWGYRLGDLSLVYPIARGTGPLLASAAAVVVFAERPTPLAVCGILLVCVGVLVLSWVPRATAHGDARRAVIVALLTGVLIASYTLWDKYAVGTLRVPPLLYYWASIFVQALLLTPLAARGAGRVRADWRLHRREALGVAILSPLSYILVLTALTFSPVSYIAPAREVGTLLGTAMGIRFLTEPAGRRRLVAAAAIVLGVIALAVG